MHAPHIVKDYSTERGVPICLHENRFFKMMFNGQFHYLDPVKYARGVVMVPQFANGDLLLVQQHRAPAIGVSLEFPRGGVDPNEDEAVAAVRELSEETGFTLATDSAVYLGEIAADSATLNGLMGAYYIRIPEEAQAGSFDTNEISAVVRVSHEQFQTMVRDGRINCGLSLAAYAQACLLRE
jgi:ADP-ribose pyrophosphatase